MTIAVPVFSKGKFERQEDKRFSLIILFYSIFQHADYFTDVPGHSNLAKRWEGNTEARAKLHGEERTMYLGWKMKCWCGTGKETSAYLCCRKCFAIIVPHLFPAQVPGV